MHLALGLREHQWDPWVVGPERATTYDELKRAGIPFDRLRVRPGYRHPVADVRLIWDVIRVLRTNRFDLVHAHSPKVGAVARPLAASTGVPVVFTAHGFPFNPAVRPWPAWVVSRAVERTMARQTGAIICVSRAVERLAVEHLIAPPAKLHTVHHGLPECEPDLEPDRELARFSDEGPVAGCIAVLREDKGIELFLRAAPHVLASLPEARLAVIGNGPRREALQRLAKTLDLDERLRFFPFRRPTARQLRALDVFVLSSPWDAFPIAVLEAMACGVPQVATRVGGVPEVVSEGETGLLCPPDDPVALAAQISQLLADPMRRDRMSRASLMRYRDRFTVNRMLEETAAVYDAVAKSA